MKTEKKMIIRMIALFTLVCMCLSFAGCAKNDNANTTANSNGVLQIPSIDTSALDATVGTMQSAIAKLQEVVDSINAAAVNPSATVIDPTKAIAEVKTAIGALQSTVDALGKKDTGVAPLQASINALQASVKALEGKEIPDNTAELKSMIRELQTSVNAIEKNTAIQQLQNSINKLQATVDAADKKDTGVAQLQASVNALQESVNALQNKEIPDNTADLKIMIEALQASVDAVLAKDASIQQLQASVNTLQATVDAAIADLTPVPVVSPLLAHDYGEECLEKIQYIDKMISDRDCYAGENFKFGIKWLKWNLIMAGYSEDEIVEQDFVVTRYLSSSTNLKAALSAAKSYSTDGKLYKRSGRNYVEDPAGTYVKVDVTLCNIVLVKQGKSDDQIIIGAHFDGDGTGDNGSGVALALTTAQHVHDIEVPNTLVFVFFNAEEYGCLGSTAYANSMTDEEVEKTLYMINMDSLVCGDYCYLYGGVQDNSTKTVSKTEAYENAMAVANSIGLKFKSNPWTYDNPEPTARNGVPSYASPSTGDWSDHKGFRARGIPYVYFEATNWDIPDYSGYGETYLVGMLMNTANDYYDYIESYFPGRILSHITQFSALLNALVLQENYVK